MKEHMIAIHLLHPYFGYPRLQVALWEADYLVNHKKVQRLMKELSIQSLIRKKQNHSNYTPSAVYPNRLKRQFHAIGPLQKLVTDITYISDGMRFYYLSAIQDLFNNEVVAWQISDRNDLKLVLDTVEQWTRKKDVSGIHHTIRGIRRQRQSLSQSYLPG
ncbi:IS3 family transposase [Paenibacillus sp. FSL K6-2524]|uniref:IS3 family transposase n=1 Tax=Paenibacillus sp. FSL K6-2524 TaxID=2954516 RepID=UPI0030FA10D8